MLQRVCEWYDALFKESYIIPKIIIPMVLLLNWKLSIGLWAQKNQEEPGLPPAAFCTPSSCCRLLTGNQLTEL